MSTDTAIPIEQIGMVQWNPGLAGVDLGARETTGLHATAGGRGASVDITIQMDLAAVHPTNAIDVVEFALFHLRALSAEINRRMG
jgi:hypothetical protein